MIIMYSDNEMRAATLYAKLIRALCTPEGLGIENLATYCGLHANTTARYVRALRAQQVVRVCDWDEDSTGRRSIPIYQFTASPQKDAPRPGPLSAAEKQRRYRANKRAVRWAFEFRP